MSTPVETRRKIRFADFEIDMRTAEVRQNGHKFVLQGQPFQVLAILLAGLNAVVYHVVTERSLDRWDNQARVPTAARAAGAISLGLWAIVILCGRMMSYTMF